MDGLNKTVAKQAFVCFHKMRVLERALDLLVETCTESENEAALLKAQLLNSAREWVNERED